MNTKTIEAISEGEVLDIEMDQLQEDIPIRLILEDEEIPTPETLLDATIAPPTEERGRATQVDAPQQDANCEGRKEQRHDKGHPCQGLPIPTMNEATIAEARPQGSKAVVS